MATKVPQLASQRVIRSEIFVDKSINSRKSVSGELHDAKVKQLAFSIKNQGLIHPPLLIRLSQAGADYAKRQKENYLLVAGFRRQEALDSLEIEESDYRLAPADWTLSDALAANLVENLQREDLTTYEVAEQCHTLATEHRMNAAEIATKVRSLNAADAEGNRANMSKSHVENLVRLVKKLHPKIKAAWKDGHPKASLKTLLKIAANDSTEAQLSDWKEVNEVVKRGANGKDEKGAKGNKNAVRRPSAANLAIMISRIEENQRKDAQWKKGAIVALKWAAGVVENIPGVKFDAPAKEAEEEEEEAEELLEEEASA